MMISLMPRLALLLLPYLISPVESFVPFTQIKPNVKLYPSSLLILHSSPAKRKPTLVTDEDGPTEEPPEEEMEIVEDIPELREWTCRADMPPGPIPYQPWRRGETLGCEDPITAEWRVEAEEIIRKATELAGGKLVDVTWYLTSVLVTLEEDMSKARDIIKDSGPVMNIRRPLDPVWYDPEDPNPEEIWGDENGIEGEIVYQKETEEEIKERRRKQDLMWSISRKAEDDPEEEARYREEQEDEELGLYMNEETRSDVPLTHIIDQVEERNSGEYAREWHTWDVDSATVSNIAGAILTALEDAEPKLQVLSRHEVVLASPGPPGVLETQEQFDAYRGEKVTVQTQDPFQSNRVLKGKLLDRNAMDVLINKNGRMVTIPNNFVRCVSVELPEPEEEEEEEAEGEDLDEDEWEYEYQEEEE